MVWFIFAKREKWKVIQLFVITERGNRFVQYTSVRYYMSVCDIVGSMYLSAIIHSHSTLYYTIVHYSTL